MKLFGDQIRVVDLFKPFDFLGLIEHVLLLCKALLPEVINVLRISSNMYIYHSPAFINIKSDHHK